MSAPASRRRRLASTRSPGGNGQPRLSEPPAKPWRRRGSASSRGGETVSSADGRTSGPVGEDSELDTRAELDDPVWRDAEEVGRRTRVARHEAEQTLAPPHHRGWTGRQKLRTAEVVGGLLRFRLDAEV